MIPVGSARQVVNQFPNLYGMQDLSSRGCTEAPL